jgi:hypothetical protein
MLRGESWILSWSDNPLLLIFHTLTFTSSLFHDVSSFEVIQCGDSTRYVELGVHIINLFDTKEQIRKENILK